MIIRDADIVIHSRPSKRLVRQKQWIRPRLEWLEHLETKSNLLTSQAILSKQEEIKKSDHCCFPFNTFGLFNRSKMKEYQYYLEDCDVDILKNDEEKV
jgi:hypothetical protein